MDFSFLEFELPLWWILPALLLAIGLSYLLYQKKGVPWGKNQNLILGTLRFLAIFLILIMFLEPYLRRVSNETERPIVVVGVDNSSSLNSIHSEEELIGLLSSLEELKDELESDKDYRVQLVDLNGSDSISFGYPITDYSSFFRFVEDEFRGKNLGGVVLCTDGIFNRGASPSYKFYSYPVYTLGMGDTIPQRDVVINEVRHNAVAYQGNEFPVRVSLSGVGYQGENVEVKIVEKGVVLDVSNAILKNSGNEFTFFLNANESGVKHYTILAQEFNGETTLINNRREVFIEVLESKKRVLVSADSPHPEIRAIRSVLEETGNYEVIVFIEGVNDRPEISNFDVQILLDGVNPFPNSNSPSWIINSSNLGQDLESVPFIEVVANSQPDPVTPAYNTNFTKFKLNQEVERLDDFPPILVPFGEYNLSGPYEILFYQRVGSVVTGKPLVVAFDDGNKRQVVTLGTGIWQWRLQESAINGDSKLFTEIVQKLIQYLSINESKKQFRVTRGLDIFTDGEVIFFDVEIYDDIFQPLEGHPYTVEIKAEDQSVSRFDFVFGSENKVARTTSFEPGTYSYIAKTTIGENTYEERGEFVVNALELEQLKLTADHNLLRQIATKSGGEYYHLSQIRDLKNKLMDTSYKGIIHPNTEKSPLVSVMWLLVIICCLLATEWVLRKFWGAY